MNRLGGSVKGVGNSQQCKSNLQKVLFQESKGYNQMLHGVGEHLIKRQEEGAPGHYVHELPLPGGPFIATAAGRSKRVQVCLARRTSSM